jgi:hypothetical protein
MTLFLQQTSFRPAGSSILERTQPKEAPAAPAPFGAPAQPAQGQPIAPPSGQPAPGGQTQPPAPQPTPPAQPPKK